MKNKKIKKMEIKMVIKEIYNLFDILYLIKKTLIN